MYICEKTHNKIFIKLNWKSTKYILIMSSVSCDTRNCLVLDVGMWGKEGWKALV